MLYDDGARLNYMSSSVFETLKERYDLVLLPDHMRHFTASNEPLPVRGYTILPHVEVADSFGRIHTTSQAVFRVCDSLNYLFIGGTTLHETLCDPGNGCLVFPVDRTVRINVSFNAERNEACSIGAGSAYFTDGSKVTPLRFEPDDGLEDDVFLNNIEPSTSHRMINIGTKEAPILTSAARSEEFKSGLKALIAKYPEPFKPGLGKMKNFKTEAEFKK